MILDLEHDIQRSRRKKRKIGKLLRIILKNSDNIWRVLKQLKFQLKWRWILWTNDKSFSNLSSFSIRKILKRDLKMAHKKADWIHQNYFRPENSRKFVESVAILMKLKCKNFKLIYFDEFKINMRNEKSYTWSKIGRRGYIKRSAIESQYSFIIAFWEDHIYGIRPNDETNNSSDFLAFINEVFHIKLDVFKESWKSSIIVWDNASIHKTDEIKKNLIYKKLLMVTIWPYMPCLNSAEKLIGIV